MRDFRVTQNKVYGVILGVAATLAALPLPAVAEDGCRESGRDPRVVRAVVIGGMTREVDLWPAVAQKFEEKTGYRVELVDTGTVDVIAARFAAGEADLLTMHTSDTTTNLVADGYGDNMRPWAHNDLVIMGPASDPAGIQGMTDGVEALKKIAAAGALGLARFVDLWGTGKREVSQDLWARTGIYPVNKSWFVKDLSDSEGRQLVYTGSLGNAYCLFGRVPVVAKKVNTGGLRIMVEGDLAMQRPFIVMEANPERFPCTNHVGARKLVDFLLSREIQEFLPQFRVEEFLGLPPFYPLRNAAFDLERRVPE
jgi:tungstate transport system substrate-binding protein